MLSAPKDRGERGHEGVNRRGDGGVHGGVDCRVQEVFVTHSVGVYIVRAHFLAFSSAAPLPRLWRPILQHVRLNKPIINKPRMRRR